MKNCLTMSKAAQRKNTLFNIGEMATHRATGRPRIIRHIKFNHDGEMILGFGNYPTGFVFAKHYRKYGEED